MQRVAHRNINAQDELEVQPRRARAVAVAPVSARAEQPPQAVPEEGPVPLNTQALVPYKCNLCLEYVRGGVITICGHLFCWQCLWPLLAGKPSPECPRCQTALILYEDILPFYGEGPNATAEDCHVLAEPGAVPRPTGICLRAPEEEIDEDLEIDEDDEDAEDDLLFPPAQPAVLCPRIELAMTWLKYLQVVCAVLIGLVWCFFVRT